MVNSMKDTMKDTMKETMNETQIRTIIGLYQTGRANKCVGDALLELTEDYLKGVTYKTLKGIYTDLNKKDADNVSKLSDEVCQYFGAAWQGLIQAVSHFDLCRSEAKFSTYAYQYVKAAVKEAWVDDREINPYSNGKFSFDLIRLDEILETMKDDEPYSPYTEGLDIQLCAKETRKSLRKAINSLEPNVREIIMRSYRIGAYDDPKTSRKEVAKAMNMPEWMVTGLLNAGLQELKEFLEEEGVFRGSLGQIAA